MDLSGESNCSEGKRVPTAVGRLLTPLANAEGHPHVRNQIACHWRHPLLTRAITPEATCMSEQLRRELADVVGPDVERLASWMGPSFSGWGLLARPAVGCQHQVLRAELASASPDAASTAVVEALWSGPGPGARFAHFPAPGVTGRGACASIRRFKTANGSR